MTETLHFALRRAIVPLMLRNLRELIIQDPQAALAWIDESLQDDERAKTQAAQAKETQA